MPRQARLDAPGTLHHVIIRGIERKEIVKDDHDRQNFVYRMGMIALETGTLIYAWTLMTNHAHIFLRSSSSGISRYMSRLLKELSSVCKKGYCSWPLSRVGWRRSYKIPGRLVGS